MRTELERLRPAWVDEWDPGGALEAQRRELVAQALEIERLNAALSASRERYRRLFDRAPVCHFVLDGDGVVREVNDTALDRLGYARSEIVGRPLMLIVATRDRTALLHHRARARLGHPHTSELEILSRRGMPLRVQLDTVVLDLGDGEPGVLATAVEVTARVLAEDGLRHARMRLTAVIEAAPVGIVGLDANGRVQVYNQAAAQVLGWESGEGLGQCLADAEPAPPELDALTRRVLAGDTVRDRPVQLCARGDERSVLVAGGPTHDHEGELNGAVLVLSDVTVQRRLERRVRQSQKLEALGQLAAGVAHDFNNLLTAILSGTSLVARALPAQDPVQRHVTTVATSARRAAVLTRQLLTFGRRSDTSRAVLTLDVALAELREMLLRVLPETVSLVFTPGAPGLAVRLGAEQLGQIVVNLAVNARDAMPHGGRLELRTSVAREDGRPFAVLEVRDTGAGMSETVQERIFEPFFTTKAPGEGTGLGLATVYGLVTAADGTVDVASTLGAGTTFRVSLPALRADATHDDLVGEEAGELAGDETILLVEDEPLVRDATRAALSAYGYRVHAASGLAEAAWLLARHASEFGVLVTDMVMPDGSGLEVAAVVRARRRDLPVIVISGYTPDEIRSQIPTDFTLLPKPFAPEELARALRVALGPRAPR